MTTIAASMSVFNEELRIESTLRSLVWCDEIIILDKESTDRTVQIAKRYTNKIISTPHREFRHDEIKLVFERIQSEWILGLTASDMVSPQLAYQIRNLINQRDFPYDVIHVPFRRYVLGLESPHSPWHSKLNPLLYRKRVTKIDEHSVHGALTFDTKRHYKMPYSKKYCIYHLTHSTADIMMDRHLRYWRAEAEVIPNNSLFWRPLKDVLRSFFVVTFRKRTWLMGWDGIALAMAFLSYFMMQFVYVWEKKRSKAPQTYREIRDSIMAEWEKYSGQKNV